MLHNCHKTRQRWLSLKKKVTEKTQPAEWPAAWAAFKFHHFAAGRYRKPGSCENNRYRATNSVKQCLHWVTGEVKMRAQEYVKHFQHGGIFTTGAKCVLDASLPVSAISCKVIMEYGGSWSLKNNTFGRAWAILPQRSECRTYEAVTTPTFSKHHIKLQISPYKNWRTESFHFN